MVKTDPAGATSVAVLYEKPTRRKRRSSRELRPLEKLVHSVTEAQATMLSEYRDRHERSNAKRDGWLKDFPENLMKASRKGRKKLKIEF
jgi:hypothetical protein